MHNLTVEQVANEMKHFGWVDYLVSVLIGLIYISVGLYSYFKKSSGTAQDYLVGGRSMSPFPIAVSLVATFFSGITMLGIPTEIYIYGMQFCYALTGLLLMTIIFQTCYLPVLYDLKITSVYEYLERRFDWKARLLGSILFILGSLVWLPIVIYTPALAFNQATGLSISVILPVACFVCVFYTAIGGLRAVVWTDLLQAGFMITAMILLAIKGTVDVGGLGVVLDRNNKSGRIEAPNLDFNPLTRHTLWCLSLGVCFNWLNGCGLNQNMIQRYVAVPNLKAAIRALWYCTLGLFIVIGLCVYCGLLIYATYHDCDPISTNLVKQKDQLLLLLVNDVIGIYPGLTGIFLAGVFGASLSSLSTGLNSLSAVILEDFYKKLFKHKLTSKQSQIFLISCVIIAGCICLGLSYLVGSLGTLVQLNISVGSIMAGPVLALFTMGLFFPWVNSTGAVFGGVSGLLIMSWLCVNVQIAIATGNLTFETKPFTTDGCSYNFTPIVHTNTTTQSYVFPLFRISYMWYTTCGATISMVIASLVSLLTKGHTLDNEKIELLAPFVRRFVVPNKSNEKEIYVNAKLLNGDANNIEYYKKENKNRIE